MNLKALRKENRGLSLVELIVTIALLTIVGGAITAFMSFTQRSYTRGVTNTELQTDSQLVANQIQELLFDAIDVKEVSSDVYDKLYEVYYSETEKGMLGYKAEDRTIWFMDKSGEEDILATNVDLFEFQGLASLDRDRALTVVLRLMMKDGSSLEASHKIYFRNTALADSVSEDWKDNVDLIPANIKVSIDPEAIYVWPGSSYALSAIVTVTDKDGKKIQPLSYQSVHWEVSGTWDDAATATKVNDNTNLLTVDLNEMNDTGREDNAAYQFTIKAKSSNIDVWATKPDSTELDEITAYVRTISNISFRDTQGNIGTSDTNGGNYSGEGYGILPGATLKIYPKINGQNISSLSLTDLGGLNVTISGDEQYLDKDSFSVNQSTGEISVKTKNDVQIPSGEDKTFTVKIECRQYGFTDKKLELTYKLKSQAQITLDSSTSTIQRNGVAHLTISNGSMTEINKLKTAAADTNPGYIVVDTKYYLGDALVSGVAESYSTKTSGATPISGTKYLRSESGKPLVFGFESNSTANDFYVKLREDTVSYGDSVADTGINNKHKFDKIVLTVSYKSQDGTRTYGVGTYELSVAENIALEYSLMAPNATDPSNSRWADAVNRTNGQNSSYSGEDVEYIFVTNHEKENKTKELYYTFVSGYTTADEFGFDTYKNNNNYPYLYQPNLTYYTNAAWKNLMVGVGSDDKIYSNLGVEDVETDTVIYTKKVNNQTYSYKAHKLTFNTQSLISAAVTNYGTWENAVQAGLSVDEVFGYSKTDTKTNSGLSGRVRFVAKNPNVFITYNEAWKNEIKGWYCPTLDDFNGMSNLQYGISSGTDRYYYVSTGERYHIYDQDNTYYADYETQKTIGGEWESKAQLVYKADGENGNGAGWYDEEPTENIHLVTAYNIYYRNNKNVIPAEADLQCGSFGEIQEESIFTRDYDYYIINDKYYEADDVKVVKLNEKDEDGYTRYFVATVYGELYYAYFHKNSENDNYSSKTVKVGKNQYVTYWYLAFRFDSIFYWKQDTTGEYGWWDVNTTNIKTSSLPTLPLYLYVDTDSRYGVDWDDGLDYWDEVADPKTKYGLDIVRSNVGSYKCLEVGKDLYLVPRYTYYNSRYDYATNRRFVAYYKNGIFQCWLKESGDSNFKYNYYSKNINQALN